MGDGRSMFDLSGKGALVTGASGGIGGAIARALRNQGARLALSGVSAIEHMHRQWTESGRGLDDLSATAFALGCVSLLTVPSLRRARP